MPGSSSSSSGSVMPQPSFTTGEERRRDLVEVLLDRGERLGEPRLDRRRQLVAQLLELVEALLEVGALHGELLETLLLGVVLLLCKRVDLAELLAALLVAARVSRRARPGRHPRRARRLDRQPRGDASPRRARHRSGRARRRLQPAAHQPCSLPGGARPPRRRGDAARPRARVVRAACASARRLTGASKCSTSIVSACSRRSAPPTSRSRTSPLGRRA